MTYSQIATFDHVVRDNKLQIYLELVRNDSCMKGRLVCKQWKALIDEAIKRHWLELKANAPCIPFNIKSIMKTIESPFCQQPNVQYIYLFKKLNDDLKLKGSDIPKGELKLSHTHFSLVQESAIKKKLDESLVRMWERLFPVNMRFLLPFLHDPNEIKNWFHNPQTEPIRCSITQLNLSDLGIRFIPPEICCLPDLHMLNLSHNHIDTVPLFLGNLKKLKILNLQENFLEELPEEFASWNPMSVFLNGNPLSDKARALAVELIENRNTPQAMDGEICD